MVPVLRSVIVTFVLCPAAIFATALSLRSSPKGNTFLCDHHDDGVTAASVFCNSCHAHFCSFCDTFAHLHPSKVRRKREDWPGLWFWTSVCDSVHSHLEWNALQNHTRMPTHACTTVHAHLSRTQLARNTARTTLALVSLSGTTNGRMWTRWRRCLWSGTTAMHASSSRPFSSWVRVLKLFS